MNVSAHPASNTCVVVLERSEALLLRDLLGAVDPFELHELAGLPRPVEPDRSDDVTFVLWDKLVRVMGSPLVTRGIDKSIGVMLGVGMTTARYIIGDTRDVVASMPDNSVDLVVTSPPFLALRSYLPDDHPDKDREIGSEAGPAEFIDTLLELTAEWGRVVTDTGTIAVELGDTYSGSGGAGGDYGEDGLREGQAKFSGSAKKRAENGVNDGGRPSRAGRGSGWPMAKSLCLIPELYRVALVYGINPLNGNPSPAGRWRARNVIRWVRPNPPVGALGDKFRPATSEMVVICKASDRWFDLDAVRTEHSEPGADRQRNKQRIGGSPRGAGTDADPQYDPPNGRSQNPAGAPPLDWWKISPGGYSGSHYAVFPPELVTKPIQAMCPREVCRTCGEPRRRTHTDNPEYVGSAGSSANTNENRGKSLAGIPHAPSMEPAKLPSGWTDCGHDDYRPGIVLDPFGGSGTTGLVATGHGRDAILIDIDERNADLAVERIGMFVTVETHDTKVAA